MDAKNNFNGYTYFAEMCEKNKLAREHRFKFTRVTGLGGMEEVLDNLKKETAFLAVDETSDGMTLQRSGGFFKRRVYTIFLMKRYRLNDIDGHHAAISVCRSLFDQIYSRMIRDSEKLMNKMIYLNTDRVRFREMERFFVSGCAGIYFMFDVDEPIDLRYRKDEWTE